MRFWYFVFIVLFALGSLSSSHAFDLKKLEGELGNALKELEQNLNKVAPKDAQPETVKKTSETKKVVSATAVNQVLSSDTQTEFQAEIKFLIETQNVLLNEIRGSENMDYLPHEYSNFENKEISYKRPGKY